MMTETVLMNYGVLGVWLVFMIGEKMKFQADMKKIIHNNTEALYKFRETIIKCQMK